MDKPKASSESALQRMRSMRRRDTDAEIRLRLELRKLSLGYRVAYRIPTTRRSADIAFVGRKVAVFVDGCFWHGCPIHGTSPKANAEWWRQKLEANAARDRDTVSMLTSIGWLVFRVWEHENMRVAASRIAAALRSRRD